MAANSKKTSTKKKTASSKAKKKSKKSNQQITLGEVLRKQEVKSSLTFVGGLLLLIIALFSGDENSLWNTIHTFYFAVFGVCGFYIPFAVLFLGVVTVLNKQQKIHYVKLFELFVLLVTVCGLIHINKSADAEMTFGENIENIYSSVMTHEQSAFSSGGVLGAVFGGALFHLGKSKIIANIICFMCFFADIMFLFGITLFKLLSKMEKPAKIVGEYTGEAIEKTKDTYEKKIREISDNRAQRVKSKKDDVDPSKIMDDFYNSGDAPAVSEVDAEDEKAVTSLFDIPSNAGAGKNIKVVKRSEPKEQKQEDKPQNLFSIFDNVVENVSEPEAEVYADTYTQPVAEQKPEKLAPLDEKEKEELNNTLDSALLEPVEKEYVLPPLDCLNRPKPNESGFNERELRANGERLIAALNSFNVNASIVDVVPGPTVTRYELSPAPGVKISKFVGLADDLALHMAAPAGLRIEAPIPNKAAIGIEIPNKNKTTVTFREIIDTDKYRNAKSKLTVALGKDISGEPVYSDLTKMPHLLVAGTTGSGKSVCLNTMIVSLLYNATPDEVKILLIDPKQVEFVPYNGLPHLLVPVVSDPRKASGALGWAVTEMLSRYKTLNANGVRDIGAYNSLCEEREDLVKMPHIVIFIDELADLMTVAPAEVEDSIQRLAQMARAAGMHLVIATQRPSVDVITGVIKANIPSRIALTVKSQIDSRTIIDSAGAEKLMGYGDMLYYPVGLPKPIRVQGSYLADKEIENVVSFIRANGTTNYDDNVQQEIDRQAATEKKKSSDDSSAGSAVDANDELLVRAIELLVGTPEKASISALQRHLGLGFAKAGRIMDTLEQKGIVGPHEGSKPRKVLITKAQWYEMNALSGESTANANTDTAEEFSSFDETEE